jgi:serine phosphatase RsbU (regulator of sigma subunit)
MYPTSQTWTQTPAWAVVELPELFSATEVTGDWETAQASQLVNAEVLSAGRRAMRELEDVRRVSARLFPRKLPQLASLDCAGVCVEASHAGGDFYDFFELGPGRLGFVIGDVSGKGMASALVRATVQGCLRTLCSVGIGDFEQSLALVNRLLYESTPEAMYVTMFFGVYDEETQRVSYVNCGHPAALVYGRDGVSRLETTAQVLGLFSEWKCSVGEIQLKDGDTLLLYTDGITEATDDTGEEFGEDRLVAMLERQDLSLSALLRQCVQDVCRFEASHQRDDQTLVALRGVGA